MLQNLSHRALSLTFALAVTLGILGGIDALTQPQANAAQWAQKANATRA